MIGAYDEYGNVVDLVAWEKQIRDDAIREFAEWLEMKDYLNCIDIDYDWDEQSYQNICGLTKEDIIEEYNSCKGVKQNEN